jgi:beta-lactamase class D
MAMMTNSYNQSYRGAGRSKTTTTSVQPEMEIVLNKQEVIYTNENGKLLFTRIQTNNSTYWMYNNEIVEDVYGLEETYKIVNRDSKIDTILSNELG